MDNYLSAFNGDFFGAADEKWSRGQKFYGPEFVGDPFEQLAEECLDAYNYIGELERRGLKVPDQYKTYLRSLYFYCLSQFMLGTPPAIDEADDVFNGTGESYEGPSALQRVKGWLGIDDDAEEADHGDTDSEGDRTSPAAG